jgi:hypothetical protein
MVVEPDPSSSAPGDLPQSICNKRKVNTWVPLVDRVLMCGYDGYILVFLLELGLCMCDLCDNRVLTPNIMTNRVFTRSEESEKR